MLEEGGDALGGGVVRSDHEIAAAYMLHGAGLRDRGGYVDYGAERVDARSSADLLGVVDAVLHADDDGLPGQQRREIASGGGGVRRFHAEENDFRATGCFQFRGRLHADAFPEVQGVEEQAVLGHCFHERRAADHHDWRARASQHAPEIAADRASSDDGDFGPSVRRRHAVITEMRRSMSRSVLYRYGETRMLPSRKLTMMFSLRKRS